MGDHKSTSPAKLHVEMVKRIIVALSARALWVAIVYMFHHEM